MRITIELKPEHRARLLALAACRGDKGISPVIAEAVETYLEGVTEKARVQRRAIKLRGTMPDAEAERLRRDTTASREFWR